MRTQNLAIMIGFGCLAFNCILSMYINLGVIQGPTGNENINLDEGQLIKMTDPAAEQGSGDLLQTTTDTLSGIWNALTAWGYGALTFFERVVWMKGTLDNWVQGQYPYTVFIDTFQSFTLTAYVIGVWGVYTNRNTV